MLATFLLALSTSSKLIRGMQIPLFYFKQVGGDYKSPGLRGRTFFDGGLQIRRDAWRETLGNMGGKSAGTPSGVSKVQETDLALRPLGQRIRIPALGGIATTARSRFRLKSVNNPRKAVKVPFIPRNPMNNDTPQNSHIHKHNTLNMLKYTCFGIISVIFLGNITENIYLCSVILVSTSDIKANRL